VSLNSGIAIGTERVAGGVSIGEPSPSISAQYPHGLYGEALKVK
jgi:hypothetical protein